ncbi:MAG: hypothetical protein QMD85_01035 [Candidatus Aenigmarchaeota archaeon]|nr:hypothetical protein [Candidatus Aenigmarchaeota archaeon]MDI6722124.1 hypothetical protein [Candidatus Aenigmarchaeota archaeon]
MESSMECFNRIHGMLADDYLKTRSYHGFCRLVAARMSESLLDEGKDPYIAKFSGNMHENGTVRSETLVPLPYEGNASWTEHFVCCADEMAYDPIISMPVPLKHYSTMLFGEDVQMTVDVPQNKIQEFVRKKRHDYSKAWII